MFNMLRVRTHAGQIYEASNGFEHAASLCLREATGSKESRVVSIEVSFNGRPMKSVELPEGDDVRIGSCAISTCMPTRQLYVCTVCGGGRGRSPCVHLDVLSPPPPRAYCRRRDVSERCGECVPGGPKASTVSFRDGDATARVLVTLQLHRTAAAQRTNGICLTCQDCVTSNVLCQAVCVDIVLNI